jgi:transcriptional regulator with XRE-family HTH domain
MPKSIYSQRHAKLCSLLIHARKNRGLTQTKLASLLKRNQSFIAKYEAGERRLDVIEFIDVALALGEDPANIVSSILDRAASSQGRIRGSSKTP